MAVRPRVGSLFAGVEGFGQGLEAAGFEVAWQVEIDKDAVSVLERHYPNTLRVRDVRDAGIHNLTPVDVITFGSPCQGFSVAGRQAGLDDERSGLFSEAVRIIQELRPAIAVWENVPGAFSTADGDDFACVLAALADAGALDICWRVLDAQWFGVPQRRRRIFLVADFGAERAAQVLFEPEGSTGDSEACGEAGQGVAGDVEDGAGIVGVAKTLTANSGRCQVGMNYIPECFAENYHGSRETNTAPTIGAKHGLDPLQNAGGLMVAVGGITGANGHNIARAANCQQGIGDPTAQTFITETVRTHPRPGFNSVGQLAIAAPLTAGSHPNSNEPGRRREDDENLAVVTPMAVRRLTPRECERLMGWPEIFHVIGGSIDDICRSIESRGAETSTAFVISGMLRQLWITQEGGAASSGHLGCAGYVPRALSALPRTETFGARQLGSGAGAEGNLCDLRLRVSTDQAQALDHLFGPQLSDRDGTPISSEALGCIARLEGWTRWRADGSEIPDGPRYRMIGNGVVAPVAAWIGRRLFRAMESPA